MKEEEVKKDSYYNEPYEVDCPKCGKTTRVYTQGNLEYCEYMTTVFVPCSCGEYIQFDLPVN